MKTMLKVSGWAAIGLAVIYIIGIVMNVTLLDTSQIEDNVALVQFMADHAALMYTWITLLYVVFGIVLVFLSIGLYQIFKPLSTYGALVGLAFGLIWSVLVIASGMVHNVGMGMAIEMLEKNPVQAGEFFDVINSIHIGLGGGNEIPGAVWTLAISSLGLKFGYFKKWIGIVGIIVGVAGLLTIAPVLFDSVVMVFALGQMVWWVAMGVQMLKNSRKTQGDMGQKFA